MKSIEINKKYKEEKKIAKQKAKKDRILSSKKPLKATTKGKGEGKVPKAKCKLTYKSIMEKYHNGTQLLIKEKNWIMKHLIKKADLIFGLYIRTRDANSDCISFGAEKCKNKIENACHFIPRERYSHRWSEDNVFGGCINCNYHNKPEHQKYMAIEMIKRYGIGFVDLNNFTKSKRKPSIDELLQIIDKYTQLVKEL